MQRYTYRRMSTLRLTLTYILMVCIVVTVVTMLAFFVNGYRIDFLNHRIIQGGLVQLNSNPSGAAVTIDGKPVGDTTPVHTTLAGGTHTFTMDEQGYQPWKNTVDVTPGTVVWLNYVRLVPTTLTPQTTERFSALESAKASPNRKYIAVTEPSKSQIIMIDISHETTKMTTIPLPVKLLSTAGKKASSHLTIMGWSADSHYILVKHTYGKSVEWLRVDMTGSHAVRNITTELAIDFSELEFRPTKSTQFYGLTSGGDLRRVDLSSDTITAPLATDVAEYSVASDGVITFTTKYNKTTRVRTAGYISDGASRSQTLRSYTDNGKTPLHIATGVYYGTRYVAISYGKTLDVIEAHLPDSNNDNGTSTLQRVRTFSLPANNTTHLSIRTHGRFVVAQDGANVAVYDIELDNYTKMKFGTSRELQWLDDYIPWSDADGTLSMIDFDGTNRHDIMPVISGYDATLTPNGKYLYGFAKDSTNKKTPIVLNRVLMKLN